MVLKVSERRKKIPSKKPKKKGFTKGKEEKARNHERHECVTVNSSAQWESFADERMDRGKHGSLKIG